MLGKPYAFGDAAKSPSRTTNANGSVLAESIVDAPGRQLIARALPIGTRGHRFGASGRFTHVSMQATTNGLVKSDVQCAAYGRGGSIAWAHAPATCASWPTNPASHASCPDERTLFIETAAYLLLALMLLHREDAARAAIYAYALAGGANSRIARENSLT